jgi:hypothetical protein
MQAEEHVALFDVLLEAVSPMCLASVGESAAPLPWALAERDFRT